MFDLSGVTHHHAIQEIVSVLCKKTENTDTGFFNVEAAYYLGKMASTMRAVVVTKDRGEQPVNIYAIALANSGFGKGYSVNIVENELMKGFRKRFIEDTLPVKAEENFWNLATERSIRNNTTQDEEKEKIEAEYRRYGAYAFTFDDGTVPAVKQLRNKLVLAGAASINFQVDEVGSNLERSMEMLNLYLELYDQGLVKQKLTKNTAENQRGEEVEGRTPANMLLFGTPAKLFDGGKTEEMFYSLLETGYARRSLFGFGLKEKKARITQTAEEIYRNLVNPQNNSTVQKWSDHFDDLADISRFGWKMVVEDEVGIQLTAYKIHCEQIADTMKDSESIQRAELEHRHSKALKLAGAFAFVDGSNEVEMDHLMSAILLVEESGEAFRRILHQDKAHVRLGKYLADTGTEHTQHDLSEACPFYKGSQSVRAAMMTYAIAWGYTNNVIIKRNYLDGIEFFKAETLQKTSLDKLRLSYSTHWAYHYGGEEVPFDQLHLLAQAENVDEATGDVLGPMHWANHHFRNEHRLEENVLPGFNLIVIDVDGGVSLDLVHELMADYKYLTYTTKRHTPEENRFRLILPMNYNLELDSEEYKEFMNSVMAWLPFATDESANQRSKKWETFAGGTFHYNPNEEAELLDVLPFIPKTRKNEQFKEGFSKVESLDNLERWFAAKMADGNRNNMMIKFALALLDTGMELHEINTQVLLFNNKLGPLALSKEEIESTIMRTVSKRYAEAA